MLHLRLLALTSVHSILSLCKQDPGARQVMETTKGENTAMHLAAKNGHADVIKTLAAKGADGNPVNKAGAQPHCTALIQLT